MANYRKVTEAAYLVADKAWSYRAILGYFYRQHERMREFLYPEEVLTHLLQDEAFSGYTEDQLHADLSQLEKWNNLEARQDTGKVQSVEEFKKKRFQYRCTPYTVEFERMLEGLGNSGDAFGGSLERTQFERLYQALRAVADAVETENPLPEECAQRYEDVFSYFKRIIQNTSDYLAYLNSEVVEQKMQTEAFVVYKNRFTAYLRDFITGLQQTAFQIRALLGAFSPEGLAGFFEKVLTHHEKTFRLEAHDRSRELDELKEKWRSLGAWFNGEAGRPSEYETLENRTNEAIRRLTRVMQRLSERHQHFHSRKKDYMHLAEWFAGMAEIEEAHELSAVAFGVFHTRHYHVGEVPTEDIYTDVWEEAPAVHETRPRIQGYTERTRAGAVKEHKGKKEEVKQKHIQKRQEEQALIEKYISDGEIRLAALPEIEPFVRKTLLSWIGRAMTRKDRTVKTDMGRVIKVELSMEKRIMLRSGDGTLEMPDAVIAFIGEGAEARGKQPV